LTGVEQLTDAFFVMIQFLQRDSSFCHKFESVESLSLIGCTHITDLSVVHIAQLFPKLEQAVSSFFQNVQLTQFIYIIIISTRVYMYMYIVGNIHMIQ